VNAKHGGEFLRIIIAEDLSTAALHEPALETDLLDLVAGYPIAHLSSMLAIADVGLDIVAPISPIVPATDREIRVDVNAEKNGNF
jgi:hypothetical protein